MSLRLILYIAGDSPRSTQAVANLRRLCAERLDSEVEVRVVDVVREPEEAETHRILATPTLVRDAPPPRRRVTGDLSDARAVLIALDLTDQAAAKENG